VCDLLEDPARAAKLGRAAQERVRRQFSVEGMISAYERLYARLLDRRG
jgi:glycosyltransferase involved in cell wall biosynthesis